MPGEQGADPFGWFGYRFRRPRPFSFAGEPLGPGAGLVLDAVGDVTATAAAAVTAASCGNNCCVSASVDVNGGAGTFDARGDVLRSS